MLANLLAMPVVSAWVMPAGMLGLLAMPFGFDDFFWRLMGDGLQWMIDVALWVASLPGAVGRVTAFGPGYEHWTFKKPEAIDPASESYSLSLLDHAPHPLHHVAFVDSYVAHLPFYPQSMTITYALWSNKFPSTWKDRLEAWMKGNGLLVKK